MTNVPGLAATSWRSGTKTPTIANVYSPDSAGIAATYPTGVSTALALEANGAFSAELVKVGGEKAMAQMNSNSFERYAL
jgi:hypothetical protein